MRRFVFVALLGSCGNATGGPPATLEEGSLLSRFQTQGYRTANRDFPCADLPPIAEFVDPPASDFLQLPDALDFEIVEFAPDSQSIRWCPSESDCPASERAVFAQFQQLASDRWESRTTNVIALGGNPGPCAIRHTTAVISASTVAAVELRLAYRASVMSTCPPITQDALDAVASKSDCFQVDVRSATVAE